MTINRTAIDTNTTPTFKGLSVGDVFLDLEDNLICMKTEPGRYPFGTVEKPDFNAIDLSDGQPLLFSDFNPVQILTAVEPT